jgi:hypothetical protein
LELKQKEIFDKKIVEAWGETIGAVEFHNAGVDIDDDGFTDLLIIVPFVNQSPFFKRLAGLLEKGTFVSFEDKNKKFYEYDGMYTIATEDILEINKRSVLRIFPNAETAFPTEAARQKRLQSKSQASDGMPIKTVLANAQPTVIPQHFRRQGREGRA